MENKIFDLYSKKTLRGIAVMLLGVGLLFHTLGIIETGINLVLILTSVGMITYGLITSGLHVLAQKILKKR